MVDALWPSRTLARVVDGLQGCDVKPVAITGYAEPSAVFYLGTATGLGDADDAAELLRRDPECGIAVTTEADHDAFLSAAAASGVAVRRSEVRGVGEAGVGRCRSRWSPDIEKKKHK